MSGRRRIPFSAGAGDDLGRREWSVRVEYERSSKTLEKYITTAPGSGEGEPTGLYCVRPASVSVVELRSDFLRTMLQAGVLCALDDFRKNALDAVVMDSRRLRSVPLCAVLDANSRRDLVGSS
jgi:hypothetical protein